MTEAITSLSDLAAQANENHQLAVSTAGSALEFARLSGAALIEAKAMVKHGEWLPWLESNFGASRFTAANYMKLVANVESVQHLEPRSINEALRMIAGEDEEEEPEEEIAEQEEEVEAEPQHGAIQDAEIVRDEPRAVAVEVVEESEIPEERIEEADKSYRPAQALSFATMAIAQLERIDRQDTEREAAFQKIIRFCNKQLNTK